MPLDMEEDKVPTGRPPEKPPEKNKTDIKNLYKKNDKNATFKVIIESNVVGKNIGKISKLKIAKEIFDLKLNDIIKINVKGKNRLEVEFSNYSAANNFVLNDELKNKGYNIYIPYNQVTCKGVIRQVDIEFNIDIIKNMMNSTIKILDIRRLNRKIIVDDKKEYVPTGTLLITFEGIILPRHVSLYSLNFPVSIYIPPVTQCFACLLFGHTSNQCRGKQKCRNCGELKGEEESHEQCHIKCFFCNSTEHKSTSKTCPEYTRQVAIRRVMAFDNLSFYDANILCKKTYSSDAAQGFQTRPSEFPGLRYINNNEELINISQRQQSHTNTRNKRSYGEALNSTPKKRPASNTIKYNKEEHEQNLYFPNSRPEKSAKTNSIFSIPSTSKTFNPLDLHQMPASAQQNIINDYTKAFCHHFANIPLENKIKIRDIIDTIMNQDTMDLDSSLEEFF